jgi:hypothetical protein
MVMLEKPLNTGLEPEKSAAGRLRIPVPDPMPIVPPGEYEPMLREDPPDDLMAA